MPELPEIETLRRTLEPQIPGRRLLAATPRRPDLRLPFPDFSPLLGQVVRSVDRRSKYLLLVFDAGTLLIHLGMSGSLSWASGQPGKHDHLDLVFEGLPQPLRLRDPRRFGSVQFQPVGTHHPSLAKLGPEPLDPALTARAFRALFSDRNTPIKIALMDPSVVVGVGNIYATEALFRAKIDPRLAAGSLSLARTTRLLGHVQDVLSEGIALGGSTLRDFHGLEGQVGTFSSTVQAYGRAGQPCVACSRPLTIIRQGGRATVFCAHCQR